MKEIDELENKITDINDRELMYKISKRIGALLSYTVLNTLSNDKGTTSKKNAEQYINAISEAFKNITSEAYRDFLKKRDYD